MRKKEGYRSCLTQARRDKRLALTVLKAIKNGETLSSSTIAKMLNRYEASLLKLRGDTIARTESLESLNASQREALEQTLEKTIYTNQDVERELKATIDNCVRDNHAAMNRQKVKDL